MATEQTSECPDPQLLGGYADGEATQAETRRVEEHLLRCAGCASHVAYLRALSVGLRGTPSAVPSPALFDRIAAATYAAPPTPAQRFRTLLRDRVAALLAPPAVRVGFGGALAAAVVVAFVLPRAEQLSPSATVAVNTPAPVAVPLPKATNKTPLETPTLTKPAERRLAASPTKPARPVTPRVSTSLLPVAPGGSLAATIASQPTRVPQTRTPNVSLPDPTGNVVASDRPTVSKIVAPTVVRPVVKSSPVSGMESRLATTAKPEVVTAPVSRPTPQPLMPKVVPDAPVVAATAATPTRPIPVEPTTPEPARIARPIEPVSEVAVVRTASNPFSKGYHIKNGTSESSFVTASLSDADREKSPHSAGSKAMFLSAPAAL